MTECRLNAKLAIILVRAALIWKYVRSAMLQNFVFQVRQQQNVTVCRNIIIIRQISYVWLVIILAIHVRLIRKQLACRVYHRRIETLMRGIKLVGVKMGTS